MPSRAPEEKTGNVEMFANQPADNEVEIDRTWSLLAVQETLTRNIYPALLTNSDDYALLARVGSKTSKRYAPIWRRKVSGGDDNEIKEAVGVQRPGKDWRLFLVCAGWSIIQNYGPVLSTDWRLPAATDDKFVTWRLNNNQPLQRRHHH